MGIFENGRDDYMFPTTFEGMKQSGMILESGCPSVDTSVVNKDDVDVERAGDVQVNEGANCDGKKCDKKEEQVNESANGGVDVLESAIASMSEQSVRASAMSAVLGWIDGGEYTYDSLDGYILDAGDFDEDDTGEDADAYYNDMWDAASEALVVLGGSEDDVDTVFDGPSEEADKAAARLGADLSGKMADQKAEDADLINTFAVGNKVMECAQSENAGFGILEAVVSAYARNRARTRHVESHNGKREVHAANPHAPKTITAKQMQARKQAGRKVGRNKAARRKATKSRMKGIKLGWYK